ncbi:MAG TPA: LLM class F420-dependent oxidoreductase [Acidimicrobiia bacterium]|jgi:probable F420-dependent oxidoreductase
MSDSNETAPRRHGITVPFDGITLAEHREVFRELVDLGYTDVWSAESGGADAFTPLVLAAAWAPELRLGTAIIPAYTRGAMTLASQVASLCSANPGHFAVGIGSSSNIIVERWNGIAFDKPYQRVRDTLRFLRAALRNEKVTEEYETFSVRGFTLGLPVSEQPPILVAALREGMLRLAGREGDGAIINWLSAEDVATVAPIVGAGKEIVARIFVLPTEDRDLVDFVGRRAIAQYLNVPVYAAFHEWLGRGAALRPMWDAWQAGDRKAATAAIPQSLVDELIVWGPAERIRDHIERYCSNGVTTPAPAILGNAQQALATARTIAPAVR